MNNKTEKLVYTALFAAIIFLGTSFLKFEIAPKVMVHIGNALVVVAFLTLKTKHSMLAASIGFGIFDAIHPAYISALPFTILESILVLLIIHYVYQTMKEKDTLSNVIIISAIAAISKVVIIFIKRIITNTLVSGAATAIPLAMVKMPNSIITAIFTMTVAPLLYWQGRKLFQSIRKKF